MADTYTTNLSLTKPEVGASADTWGTKLNANADSVDALFTTGPYLLVSAGGTGAGTASGARTSLGLGTMATQNSNSVAVTGGTVNVGEVKVTSTEPNVVFYETDAGTNEKYWRLVTSSGAFYLQTATDAFGSFVTPIFLTRSGTTVSAMALTATTVTINGNLVYHAGNISGAAIAETQISDGSVLARVAGNEVVTGAWNFTTVPNKTSGGKFLHYASSGNSGGSITTSTSAASGTPGEGDLWIQYTA